MTKSLAELLDDGSDEELFQATVDRIFEVRGMPEQASELVLPERVVTAVCLAQGIIENGGFSYLFEMPVEADPQYAAIIDAFERLGCQPAHEAFGMALSSFPDRVPPLDDKQRLRLYQEKWGKALTDPDNLLFEAHDAIVASAADWIRRHREHFVTLT